MATTRCGNNIRGRKEQVQEKNRPEPYIDVKKFARAYGAQGFLIYVNEIQGPCAKLAAFLNNAGVQQSLGIRDPPVGLLDPLSSRAAPLAHPSCQHEAKL